MADPYIDPSETQVYGPFAREQMKDVCMGRIKELDGMVKFAIAAQADADAAMKDAIARQPSSAPPLSEAEALAEARDVINLAKQEGGMPDHCVGATAATAASFPSWEVGSTPNAMTCINGVGAIWDAPKSNFDQAGTTLLVGASEPGGMRHIYKNDFCKGAVGGANCTVPFKEAAPAYSIRCGPPRRPRRMTRVSRAREAS